MQPPPGFPASTLHRRNLSLDSATASPTSPLSRAGSAHAQFRSPLSQLRRYNESLAIDNAEAAGLEGDSGGRDKPLPLTPFEPVVFRTPYRNRSVKVRPSLARISLVEKNPSPIQGQVASLSEDLDNWSRAATVLGDTTGVVEGRAFASSDSASGMTTYRHQSTYASSAKDNDTAAPLSRVWSNPDIQWPAARPPLPDSLFSQTPSHSQTVSQHRAPPLLGESHPPAQPTLSPSQSFDTTPTHPVAHLGHVIAPSPITPVSQTRLLLSRSLPEPSATTTEGPPFLAGTSALSRPSSFESQCSSSLHRAKAISRRPSPVHLAREKAQQEFETANSPWAGLKVVSPTARTSMDTTGSSHSRIRAPSPPRAAMTAGQRGPHLLSDQQTPAPVLSTRTSHSSQRASDTVMAAKPRPSGSPRAHTSPAPFRGVLESSSTSYASGAGHRLPMDLGSAVPTPIFVLYEQKRG